MDYEVPKGFTLVDTDDYEELLEMQKWADALQGAGVDGWDGYDYAMEFLREGGDWSEYEEEEVIDEDVIDFDEDNDNL